MAPNALPGYHTVQSKTEHAHLCARVRAMRSSLIPSSELRHVESYTGLKEMIDFLLDTDYASIIVSKIDGKSDISTLEEAVNAVFNMQVDRVIQLVQSRVPSCVEVFSGEWDNYNLKAILRHLHGDMDAQLMSLSLVPAGCFSGIKQEEVLAIRSVEDLTALFVRRRTPLAEPLSQILQAYAQDGDLSAAEHALDSHYFAAFRACAETYGHSIDRDVLSSLLRFFIDVVNVKVVLRLINYTVDTDTAATLFFEGGNIGLRQFQILIASRKIDEIYKLLHSRPIRNALKGGMLHFLSSGNHSVFDRFIDKAKLDYIKIRAVSHPLSLATPLYFLALARNQVVNLRVLARGIYYHLPLGALHEELVYV